MPYDPFDSDPVLVKEDQRRKRLRAMLGPVVAAQRPSFAEALASVKSRRPSDFTPPTPSVQPSTPDQSIDGPDRSVVTAPAPVAPRIAPVSTNTSGLRERGGSVLVQIMDLRRELESAGPEQKAQIRAQIQALANERRGLNREADLNMKADRLSRPLAAPTVDSLRRSDAAMEQNYRTASEADPGNYDLVAGAAEFGGRQGKMDPTGTEADFWTSGPRDYTAGVQAGDERTKKMNALRMALGAGAREEAGVLAGKRLDLEKFRTTLEGKRREAEIRSYEPTPDEMVKEAEAKKTIATIGAPGSFDAATAQKRLEDTNASLGVSGIDDAAMGMAQDAIKILSGQMSDLRSGVVTGPTLGGGNEDWTSAIGTLETVISNLELAEQQLPGSARRAAQVLYQQLPTAPSGKYQAGYSLGGGVTGSAPIGVSPTSMAKALQLTKNRGRLRALAGQG